MPERKRLTRFAWLSIAAAMVTIALKASAFFLTGSVGLLSDALESGVNLVAAVMALIALTVAARPPDESHTYGHSKVEYLSSGIEGALIVIAAVMIIYSAAERFLHPQPLQQLELGLVVSLVAAIVNFSTSKVLARAAREYESETLAADAVHLMTDVWTTGGVILGVGAVVLTGWTVLDPLIAIVVAIQIIWSGVRLLRGSALGLMDTALPEDEVAKIVEVLETHMAEGVLYHALRTRRSGASRFISVHIQVPGAWTVQKGHSLLEEIEADLRTTFPRVSVFTHLEPVEDPVSWQDITLYRESEEQSNGD